MAWKRVLAQLRARLHHGRNKTAHALQRAASARAIVVPKRFVNRFVWVGHLRPAVTIEAGSAARKPRCRQLRADWVDPTSVLSWREWRQLRSHAATFRAHTCSTPAADSQSP
ncbi:TPA: hypothetical protein N0F65_005119 [Lagenidium giganteum]|uniref:Uncharacterized protein n=1 Tax=Lagenidium giganteum TaxID=4803 RepID=A0AAV2Z824_9STRA|nr:TPA: hypothetical protein N0F65_005119 [Lagenidium giganteum]